MNAFANGALIAIAAGSLFAAACQKDEKKTDKPAATETKPADKPADPAKSAVAAPNAQQPAATVEKTAKVHCSGINSCAGKGGCAGENNACAGKNGCGGQGWVETTEDECKAKNGKVLAAKEKK